MSTLYYYEPFYNFDRFFDEMYSRQNKQLQGSEQKQSIDQGAVTQTIKPRMDLHEDATKNTVTATFELPGLKKEDVQIDVHDGRLTVSGQSQISSEHEQDGYIVRERGFGKVARTLRLPQGVKDGEIKATIENGVLTVTFPKSVPEAEPKKITIA